MKIQNKIFWSALVLVLVYTILLLVPTQTDFSITGYVASGSLPKIGQDAGNWGTILNAYLTQEHTLTGGHKNITVEGNLDASGDGNFSGNLNATGNLTIGDKITFRFGEVIDNIIDGWLVATGNLDVTGDLNVSGVINSTGLNVFGNVNITGNLTSQQYAWRVDKNGTDQGSVGTGQTTITWTDEGTQAFVKGVTFDDANDRIVITKDGTYLITWGIMFSVVSNGDLLIAGPNENNNSRFKYHQVRMEAGNTGLNSVTGSVIWDLKAGDTVIIIGQNADSADTVQGRDDFTWFSGSRIGG